MLIDQFGRVHNYLRISLTERCNLRCFYCMPAEGIQLSPKENIMTADEIETIAKTFVSMGVDKIRLTGGEPLVRKDFEDVATRLGKLPVSLAITTNGVLIDQYLDVLIKNKITKINISLDTLQKEKFNTITLRNYFDRVTNNIELLLANGIIPKINVVVIKGVNDQEIPHFIELTKDKGLTVQFIEYMPFNGNKWDLSKCVSLQEIIGITKDYFGESNLIKIDDEKNATSKGYKIRDFAGKFGVISTVTNPFCDSCNRMRLTANGKMKNCLFSGGEADILGALRRGDDIEKLIAMNVYNKKQQRGGIDNFSDEEGQILSEKNRSMILIGG